MWIYYLLVELYKESQDNLVIRPGSSSQHAALHNQFCHLLDGMTAEKLLTLPAPTSSSVG